MFELSDYTVQEGRSKPKGESGWQELPRSSSVAFSHLEPDLDVAQSYMDLLHEGEATEFRVMWPKSKPLPDGAKRHIPLCGYFKDVANKLAELNKQGYGIFAVVNHIDKQTLARGGFTKSRDIVGVKAVWVDLDEPVAEGDHTHIGQLLELPYSPSMIVETSPGRFQAYWLVEDGMSTQQGVEINKALAHKLRGDPHATNISRVLRVPGFYNTKHEAMPVQIRHAEPQILSISNVYKLTGKESVRTPLVYVQDGKEGEIGTLSPDEQQRLSKMRHTHAKERAGYRQPKHAAGHRNVNPQLPQGIAQALRDCNTLAKYKSTLLRLWPKRAGNRQTLALAASGNLFRFKCSEHEAVRIIESACRTAGDDEIAERREAVRSTYRKARAGESIGGTGARAPMTVFKAIS